MAGVITVVFSVLKKMRMFLMRRILPWRQICTKERCLKCPHGGEFYATPRIRIQP